MRRRTRCPIESAQSPTQKTGLSLCELMDALFTKAFDTRKPTGDISFERRKKTQCHYKEGPLYRFASCYLFGESVLSQRSPRVDRLRGEREKFLEKTTRCGRVCRALRTHTIRRREKRSTEQTKVWRAVRARKIALFVRRNGRTHLFINSRRRRRESDGFRRAAREEEARIENRRVIGKNPARTKTR